VSSVNLRVSSVNKRRPTRKLDCSKKITKKKKTKKQQTQKPTTTTPKNKET
jgi:hypothetical protein